MSEPNFSIQHMLEALESSRLGTAVAESTWLFPTLETVHVLALCLVVGSIWIVDARLLGWGSRGRTVRDLTTALLPWTWSAFAVATLSGLLLFSSAAVRYFDLLPFRVKFLLLVLAGLNMGYFHLVTARGIAVWDRGLPPPAARAAGALSMMLWIGIVGAGRWIGFV